MQATLGKRAAVRECQERAARRQHFSSSGDLILASQLACLLASAQPSPSGATTATYTSAVSELASSPASSLTAASANLALGDDQFQCRRHRRRRRRRFTPPTWRRWPRAVTTTSGAAACDSSSLSRLPLARSLVYLRAWLQAKRPGGSLSLADQRKGGSLFAASRQCPVPSSRV